MGDIAEAMLEGTLCCSCGSYLGLDCGFPVECSDCRREAARARRRSKKRKAK